jgi:hypothetical protein
MSRLVVHSGDAALMGYMGMGEALEQRRKEAEAEYFALPRWRIIKRHQALLRYMDSDRTSRVLSRI